MWLLYCFFCNFNSQTNSKQKRSLDSSSRFDSFNCNSRSIIKVEIDSQNRSFITEFPMSQSIKQKHQHDGTQQTLNHNHVQDHLIFSPPRFKHKYLTNGVGKWQRAVGGNFIFGQTKNLEVERIWMNNVHGNILGK